VVTAAFYVLGAGLLHGRGELPGGGGGPFLEYLAGMYTTTLGGWAEPVFYFGAFVVLFSTAFAALAAWTRQFADAFGQIGLFDFSNNLLRRKWIFGMAWGIPILWALAYKLVGDPVFMVFAGGFVTSIILLVVLYAAIFFRKDKPDSRLSLGKWFTLWFRVSALMILFVVVWTIVNTLIKGVDRVKDAGRAPHESTERAYTHTVRPASRPPGQPDC